MLKIAFLAILVALGKYLLLDYICLDVNILYIGFSMRLETNYVILKTIYIIQIKR